MNIFIIGAGALGLYVGSIMHRGGASVTFLTRTAEQAQLLNTSGLIVGKLNGDQVQLASQAHPINQAEKPLFSSDDLVFITLKQYQLDTILPWMKEHIPHQTPLIFLMNGMGHMEKVRQHLDHQFVYYGMTQISSTKRSGNYVQERGRGSTLIGSVPPNKDHTQPHPQAIHHFVEAWRKQGLDIDLTDSIVQELWKKLIINACINPLTAIYDVRNGELLEQPKLLTMMEKLYQEAAQLVAIEKPSEQAEILQNGRLWLQVQQVCQVTAGNMSSMLQDLKNDRATEIEAITGYLLKTAEQRGVYMPTHQEMYDQIMAR